MRSESERCSVVSDSLRPHGLYSPGNSPGQNTGVGSLSLLQRIFLTQKSKLCQLQRKLPITGPTGNSQSLFSYYWEYTVTFYLTAGTESKLSREDSLRGKVFLSVTTHRLPSSQPISLTCFFIRFKMLFSERVMQNWLHSINIQSSPDPPFSLLFQRARRSLFSWDPDPIIGMLC